MHNYSTLNPNVATVYTPLQIATIYNYPQNQGDHVKIGIVNLDCGYQLSDITKYCQSLNIVTPTITNVLVGSTNKPGYSDADMEATLDLSIIAALVPKSNIRMYFAPNSFNGFYEAFNKAINDNCQFISCSWGLYEDGYGSNLTKYNNLFAYAVTKNINIFCAAGDNGSSDGFYGNNVDFPGSSPNVICCGGTTLLSNNNVRTSEKVWNHNGNATGGGLSKYFSKPAFQNNVLFDLKGKRGVADLSGVADPNTGIQIYYRNRLITIGGTSATAPLMTALFARISVNRTLPFINPMIYQNPNLFYDIISGNNGAFSASLKWDCCSGLGVPDGMLMFNLFTATPSSSLSPPPTIIYAKLSRKVVYFKASATNGLWQFGDGSTSNKQITIKTYRLPGTYTVTLTVDDQMVTKNIII